MQWRALAQEVMGGDFVLLTEDLWEKLAGFRKCSVSLNCSVVEEVELLRYWRTWHENYIDN